MRCLLLVRILEFGGIKTLRVLLVQFTHCTHDGPEAQKEEVICTNLLNKYMAEAGGKAVFQTGLPVKMEE